jgi:hypothetical protein
MEQILLPFSMRGSIPTADNFTHRELWLTE